MSRYQTPRALRRALEDLAQHRIQVPAILYTVRKTGCIGNHRDEPGGIPARATGA